MRQLSHTTLVASTIALLVMISRCSYAICNQDISPTAPSSRYELVNNGSEVKDKQTGLIWQRCSLGQVWDGTTCQQGRAKSYNWTDAIKTAEELGNSWRVPNIRELNSLVEQACDHSSINETYFPNTIHGSSYFAYYWSSSPAAGETNSVWVLTFSFGNATLSKKNKNNYVRLVRSVP